MALKAKITADEYAALDEAHKSLYKQGSDGYLLDAEGVEDVAGLKSALEKERKARRDYEAKVKEIEQKFDGLDPEQARKAQEELQKLNDKKMLEEGKVEELLNTRTEALKKAHATQLAAEQAARKQTEIERDKYKNAYEEIRIDGGLREAAAGAKVRSSAMTDLLLRGRRIWKLHDGKPTPFRDGGDEILYGKDPSTPMSMDEWVLSLQQEAPHLFEDSKGAGTEPNASRVSGNRITLTRDQARDVRTWRNAEAQAVRTGAQIVVQD